MTFGRLAPAGTRIEFGVLLRWLLASPRAADELERLRRKIVERYDVDHAYFVSSGRAALVILLQALSRLAPNRREVLIPAYTCYSVPAAIVRAGLRVRVCDINPMTLDYDRAALAATNFTEILAVMSANLYGIPNNLGELEAVARRHGAFFIDDAAQCLDGRVANRAAGSFGDAGIFSFDKGKNITSMQGGVLVTRSRRVATEIERALASIPASAPITTLLRSVQLLAYAALLRPSLYWIPANVPFMGLGRTVYTLEYPITHYHALLGSFVANLFARIERLTADRIDVAHALRATITPHAVLRSIEIPGDARPVYTRFPILAPDSGTRAVLLGTLARLGASGSYPQAIPDVPAIRPHLAAAADTPGARRVAATIFTLPTHGYVRPRHVRAIAAGVGDALRCGGA